MIKAEAKQRFTPAPATYFRSHERCRNDACLWTVTTGLRLTRKRTTLIEPIAASQWRSQGFLISHFLSTSHFLREKALGTRLYCSWNFLELSQFTQFKTMLKITWSVKTPLHRYRLSMGVALSGLWAPACRRHFRRWLASRLVISGLFKTLSAQFTASE